MISNFLYKNIRWQFRQNQFEHLLGATTTEQQYYHQLEKIANNYYPEARPIDTLDIEFCLNKIALSRATNPAEKVALGYFQQYWTQYTRLANLFKKKYLTFPANGNVTRLEQIAELLTKCTQFAIDEVALARLCWRSVEIVELNEREQRYLAEIVELYKLKYYCGACLALLSNKAHAEKYLARFLQPTLLKKEHAYNKKYIQAPYFGEQIATVVDCMGQSAAKLGNIHAKVDVGLFVYANGRNVFDTFCKSRFGEHVAEFVSSTPTMQITMRYFVQEQKEIRTLTLTNNGKRARKFSVEIPFGQNIDTANYFKMGNALCIASDLFAGLAVVYDNQIIECYGEQAQCFDVVIGKNSSYTFDIVTIYSTDTPTMCEVLEQLEQMGNTRAPYLYDNACTHLNVTGINLQLSPHGHVMRQPQKVLSNQLNYSYQLGNNDVATFVDNGGNSTTLIDGFAFGVKGEGVYSVTNGLITKLNEHNFHIDIDRLYYNKASSSCVIYHDKGKIYEITHAKIARTLFYFPLEMISKVTYNQAEQTFTVTDNRRQYSVKCIGEVESYTTNALECSERKLRYKLSCDIETGSCLAICFAQSTNVQINIISARKSPPSTPIIRESLVSTYLNYINDKSVFCLSNNLKRADCLTLAAICYTNPQFVKEYLTNMYQGSNTSSLYYDSKGEVKTFSDKFAYPLGVVYYANLVGALPEEMIKKANEALFDESCANREICIKALALFRASRINGFDKVRCLVEYNKLKKIITADSKLYAYAQAIGAIPLTNPSKERLKDLCNRYEIPKSWYYVSQLENLYGLSISAGKLHICPKVTAENVLEQFALNISGKRIDTTFAKASVQSMTLNGVQCFQPFYPQNLKNEENQLVVRY